jgi:hypothetical protein
MEGMGPPKIEVSPTTARVYYLYWLAALERLVKEESLTESSAPLERKEAWADQHTPHGQPVELGTGHSKPKHS